MKCRETTNQRLIDFYDRAYNDLVLQERQEKMEAQWENDVKVKLRNEFLKFVRETTVASLGPELPDFEKIWRTVFLGQ